MDKDMSKNLIRWFKPFADRFAGGKRPPGAARMRGNRGGNRGIALVTVLLVVALLVAVVVEFNRIAMADIQVSNNFMDERKIVYTTVSGISAIGELLLLDRKYTQSDNLLDEWAQGETYFEAASMLLDEGQVSGTITDEEGKININSLVGNDGKMNSRQFQLWKRLLEQPEFQLNEQKVLTIIHGVKDWLDADDEVSAIYGAEDETYRPLGYQSKNGPMDTVEEMLLVNGVTDELFYGSRDRPGIQNCFTVYGDERVNINTAPIPVLRALSPLMTETEARELHSYRTDPVNRDALNSPTWYLRLWPYDEPIPAALLTARSDYFTVRVSGTLRESRKHVRAVILRKGAPASIIYWQETVQ